MRSSTHRILIVDDEPKNCSLFELLLQSQGYRTSTSSSGEDALAAVAESAPDLILLDMLMPGIDGDEVAMILKADPHTSNIPIIMVTALDDRGARLAGLDAGAEEILSKPVDRTELWLRVRNLLRLKDTQAELELARAEADRANEAKSEFLSRMSHDLRTPLSAVLGFGHILLMDDVTDDQRESIEFIVEAGQHLLEIVNDVLDVARIEAGALQLVMEPVHLSLAVNRALDLVRLQANERNLRIVTTFDDEDAHVEADRKRLMQVLLNVLSNAIKYNRPGGQISVDCQSSGGTVSIAVTDTGIGITEEGLTRLFTPFERLGAEYTGVEGTGVGLAISRVLCQHMGGIITVDSRVGVGTTFTLELQAAEAVTPPAAAGMPAMPAPAAVAPAAPRPVCVLCIEDNEANLRLVERTLLGLTDVRLLTATDGRLGLDLARVHHPDLVFLGLCLPDMSGEDVLGQLRADPSTASIRVYITTADASEGQADRLGLLGADEYLTKPMDADHLVELVVQAQSAERVS